MDITFQTIFNLLVESKAEFDYIEVNKKPSQNFSNVYSKFEKLKEMSKTVEEFGLTCSLNENQMLEISRSNKEEIEFKLKANKTTKSFVTLGFRDTLFLIKGINELRSGQTELFKIGTLVIESLVHNKQKVFGIKKGAKAAYLTHSEVVKMQIFCNKLLTPKYRGIVNPL